ncbi:hypothetical protein FOYG_11646 [Fusarium oxysporum NRRL 32931]|uniref:Uncharacterized protein n=1 Tax=Fusarium oxysporum NRRL 32931 TaxID=660029 RepID=W9I4P9_FUSOX|nr:hypothetical protein FOYG_11646 [Fusarium oxysporum NRRL 32931]
MNPHIKEAQSRRPRSSDEMDELQNGAPEFEDIPSADMCWLPHANISEANARLSSIGTARRHSIARPVTLLKAEKDHEVREKKPILEKGRLEAENAALVAEVKRLRAKKAQDDREKRRLQNKYQVLEADLRYKDDLIDRLKDILRKEHLL